MIQRSVQLLQEQAVDYAVTIGCEMHDEYLHESFPVKSKRTVNDEIWETASRADGFQSGCLSLKDSYTVKGAVCQE